jgi:hypothetical protein
MKKLILIVTVFIGLGLTFPGSNAACGCAGITPSAKSYKVASDVFIAFAVRVRHPPSVSVKNANGSITVSSGVGPNVVTLAVEKSFKGAQDAEVEFEVGVGGCDYYFEVGERYLVYAHRENGKFHAHKCLRTGPVSKAKSDLAYMEGMSAHKPQATLYGYVLKEIVDADGRFGLQVPFEKTTVVLEGGGVRLEACAETSGEYEIIAPPGKYEVWVERAGRMMSERKKLISLNENECTEEMLAVRLE